MSPSNYGDKKFQLRDRHKRLKGTYTKAQILERIRKGKYSGEEEVSIPPYTEWHKLASYAAFFDALVHRIFEAKQEEEGEDKEASKQKAKVSAKTSQHNPATVELNELSKLADPEDLAALTRQIPAELGPEVKVDPHLIDDLFSESIELSRSIELSLSESVQIGEALEEPLDISEKPEPTESPPSEAKKSLSKRSKVLWGSVGLLVLLLYLGREPSPKEDQSNIGEAADPLAQLKAAEFSHIQSLFRQADAYFYKDIPAFYEAASHYYEKAVGVKSKQAKLYGDYAEASAWVYRANKQKAWKERALNQISKGRSIDPQFSQFYRVESRLAFADGDLQLAKEKAKFAMESDERSPRNALLVGELAYADGDLKQAQRQLAKATVETATRLRAHYLLAKISQKLSDYRGAKDRLQRLLLVNPLHVASQIALADIYSKQGQIERAIQLYTSASRLARLSTNEQAVYVFSRLGALFEFRDKPKEAAESFALAAFLKANPNPWAKAPDNQDPSYLKWQERLIKHTYDGRHFAEVAAIKSKEKNNTDAMTFYEAASVLEPKNGRHLVSLGSVIVKNAVFFEEFQRAMAVYANAIVVSPKLTEAYIQLGLLETEHYNLDRGYELLNQALVLNPDQAAPHLALGKHFYRRKDFFRAKDFVVKAGNIEQSSETLYYAGLLLNEMGKGEGREALSFFWQSYLLEPNFYPALVEWLKLKVQFFEKTKAIKFVRNLLKKEPNNAQYYWALGEIYAANGEYQRAIGFYRQGLDRDNRAADIRIAYGTALESVGKLSQAAAEFRLSSMLDARKPEGYFKAGELWIREKKFAKAETVLNELVRVSPRFPGVYRGLAQIYQAQEERDRAVQFMRKEVENNPQNTRFRIELAQLYMLYEKYESAISELKEVTNLPKVIESPQFLRPKKAAYLLLSQCYRQLKEYRAAESVVRLAMELDSADPVAYRELGSIYLSQKRDREALEAYKTYLKKFPSAPDAGTIRGLMKRLQVGK